VSFLSLSFCPDVIPPPSERAVKELTLEPFMDLGLNRVENLASKLHVNSVIYAAKLVHTKRAFSSTIINSHQEPFSGQACNPPDPH